MPHATNMPSSGFQAVILCGPGVSLNTFTSNPEEFPKALVPIANRPMVWYPLDWCYRAGITKIHLVTPPSSVRAIEAALSQNPHLTSLPLPKADIVAPEGLTHTTGTAELLMLPELRNVITSDFLVLPCDLVSEVSGEALLESWMAQQGALGGAPEAVSGQRRRGGLGVWFETRGDDHVKGAETDFVITTSPLQTSPPAPMSSLRPNISALLYTSTTDSLRDIIQENGAFPIRSGLIRKHGKIRMLTTYRAAHVYLFPYWAIHFIQRNSNFDSINEDVVGWWAKASWQSGLAEKLHMDEVISPGMSKRVVGGESAKIAETTGLQALISTKPSIPALEADSTFTPPIMLSYIHPYPSAKLIRRVDTPALLLKTSIRLASLSPTISPPVDSQLSPFSHPSKVATDPSLIAPHTTIHIPSTLIAPNTSIATHCTIKSSCIGDSCMIGEGTRITDSLLMDNVQVENKASIQGCILGRRCVIGKGAKLDGCEIQEGFRVEEGTVGSKGEKFCVFEGLDNDLATGNSDVNTGPLEESSS